jgi:hypothetical protein
LQTNNYKKLNSFTADYKLEVQILGHSCGLSDKTLLHEISEHDDCKFIDIFYHKREDGKNDFDERLFAINRLLKDKTKLRKRINSFENSKEMPQIKKGL